MSNNSESDSEYRKKMEKMTEEFKEWVINWVERDDHIRKLNTELKECKEEKKQFEEAILEHMEAIDENIIGITNGKLRKNKSKSTASLKQDTIKIALAEIINDEAKAIEMTKYIMDKRDTVEKINLKRTFNRGKKEKK